MSEKVLIYPPPPTRGALSDPGRSRLAKINIELDQCWGLLRQRQALQDILSVADDEWKSLIRFGLYTGQRLSDIALLTWANIDLERDEIRFIARKTGKTMLLPIAETLRQHIEALANSDDPAAPLHPRAYKILRRQKGHGRTQPLSQAFGDLLAAAGLRTHRYKKYKSSRGSAEAEECDEFTAGLAFTPSDTQQSVCSKMPGYRKPRSKS